MSEDMVESVMLGSVASQYYLSYMTVSMFGSNIGPDTSLEVRLNFSFLLSFWHHHFKYPFFWLFKMTMVIFLCVEVFLHVLSAASEFDELPVRHNEVTVLLFITENQFFSW